MDIVFNRHYNGCDVELIIEDDIITTAKVFRNGVCVEVSEITEVNGNDVPYNRKNLASVYEVYKGKVNELMENYVTR